jgi:hypothetical protein
MRVEANTVAAMAPGARAYENVRMRALVLVAAVAGCGRFGFASADGGAARDLPDPRDAIAADAPDAAPADPSLLAYYTMDSLDGTTLHDASGYGHDGTCTPPACPTLDTGVVGGALRFDGVDDLITVPDAAALQLTDTMTVTAWFETDQLGGANTFYCYFNKLLSTGNDDSWQLCVQGDQLTGFVHWDSGSATSVNGPHAVDIGNWHHVAMAVDNQHVYSYFDGAPTNTGPVALPIDLDGDPITLGADIDSGALDGQLRGRLDELRIYDRVLSAAEVAALAAP